MSTIKYIRQPIWAELIKHVKFLRRQRKHAKNNKKRLSINWSIIISLACYIEGKVEYDLKGLISHRIGILGKIKIKDFYQRRSHNIFIHRIEDYLMSQTGRNTGVDNLDSIIYLLSWKNVPRKLTKFHNWEGVSILFQFRNVLAHGREISASKIIAPWLEKGFRDDFKGGYKKTEDYLCKKGITNRRVIKNNSTNHFFTNKVADHFYSITNKFVKYYTEIIKEEKNKFDILDIR